MILTDEAADLFRKRIHEEFFGADWRPDRPLENLSGNLETLIMGGGVPDYGAYQRAAGRLAGMRFALQIFEEAVKEANKQ